MDVLPSGEVRVMSGERREERDNERDCRGVGRRGRMYAVYVFVAVVRTEERVVVSCVRAAVPASCGVGGGIVAEGGRARPSMGMRLSCSQSE